MIALERADLRHNRPDTVLRAAEEARAAAKRLGVASVQQRLDGTWRAVCRNASDRAARLARIKAELGPTATDLRRARLAALAVDLQVDRLRLWRRAQGPPARAGRAVWP